MWNLHPLQDEAGDGSGADGGGGGEGTPAFDAAASFNSIKTQVEGLTAGLGKIAEVVNNLAGGHQTIEQRMTEMMQSRVRETPATPETSIDLETMDRSQFGQYIVQQVMATMKDQLVAPLENKISQMSEGLGRTNARQEAEYLASTNKDFQDFKPEIVEEIKRNGSLSLADAFLLAKARYPKKAAELEAKYNPKEPVAGKSQRNGFYGFGPSGGNGTKSTRMSQSQASEAAWQAASAAMDALDKPQH